MSEKNTVATNIRFNLDKPEDREAWEHLRHLDKREYPSYSKLVIQLINEHFRHKAALDADPYLETRAKEDAFLQKVLDTIQTGMASASSSFIAGSLLNLVQTANVQQDSGSPAPVLAPDFDDEDVTDEDVDAVFSFLDNF